jgi:hypothetical protein
MHEFLHALEHAVKDTLLLLPWLVLIYIVIELLENKTDLASSKKLQGKAAPLIGSVTGLIPQCGFSVMAAKLFEQKYITLGTLFAIFLSTSDEAFIILLSDGAGAIWLLPMLVSKIAIGILVGYTIDFVAKWLGKGQSLRSRPQVDWEKPPATVHEIFMRSYLEETFDTSASCSCGREHDGTRPFYTYAVLPALHALKVALFIFLINFALGFVIELVGEDAFSAFMQKNVFLQPVITSAIGLIPNCAASVLLTELYIEGIITLSSLTGGLCAGAGVGLIVLFKLNKNIKENFSVVFLLYAIGVAASLILTLTNI